MNGVVIMPSGQVLEIRNWSISRPQDIHDTSSSSSGGNRQKKHGMKDWSGSFETIKYIDLSGVAGVGSFKVGATATASTPIYAGTVYIGDPGVACPYDDLVTYSHTFEGSGPCTVTVS